MNETAEAKNREIIKNAVAGILDFTEMEREKDIMRGRFGLDRKHETLEKIGISLDITRERVRQLEKAITAHLRVAAENGNIKPLTQAEKLIIRNLTEQGRISRTDELAEKIFGKSTSEFDINDLTFIGTISENLAILEEDDRHHAAISIADYGSPKDIKQKVAEIADKIKEHGEPISLADLDEKLTYEHPTHVRAMASISKSLAAMGEMWGLHSWPAVNPRNIRDKIFVVLESKKEPMHFMDIAKAISSGGFHRSNVTPQAIHNELIKEPRFILIGRGIYAIDTWGYDSGTVTEVIKKLLKKAGRPVSRDEIVHTVLHQRRVKATTILLNLNSQPQFFKRVPKTDTYILAPGVEIDQSGRFKPRRAEQGTGKKAVADKPAKASAKHPKK